MKKIKINNDGFLACPYISDAKNEIEISDELEDKISSFPVGKLWKYQNGDFILVDNLTPDIIRDKRQRECFIFINRGDLWYKHLSDEQKEELDIWYQAWLDAPETKVIPTKPEWLE